MERWLPIAGFEGLYEVSDHGRVRSLDRAVSYVGRWGPVTRSFPGRDLATVPRYRGYRHAQLYRAGSEVDERPVHHLVLEAFVGLRPPGLECRHLNGKRADNCLTNLMWGTRTENAQDRVAQGMQVRGSSSPMAKLTEADIPPIRRRLADGLSLTAVAREFGVSRDTIHLIRHGRRWAHVVGG